MRKYRLLRARSAASAFCFCPIPRRPRPAHAASRRACADDKSRQIEPRTIYQRARAAGDDDQPVTIPHHAGRKYYLTQSCGHKTTAFAWIGPRQLDLHGFNPARMGSGGDAVTVSFTVECTIKAARSAVGSGDFAYGILSASLLDSREGGSMGNRGERLPPPRASPRGRLEVDRALPMACGTHVTRGRVIVLSGFDNDGTGISEGTGSR